MRTRLGQETVDVAYLYLCFVGAGMPRDAQIYRWATFIVRSNRA